MPDNPLVPDWVFSILKGTWENYCNPYDYTLSTAWRSPQKNKKYALHKNAHYEVERRLLLKHVLRWKYRNKAYLREFFI